MMLSSDALTQYRRTIEEQTPSFIRPRRFTSNDKWTKAATQDGIRYLGILRDHEPDLATILAHKTLLIIGEPGAGKSLVARATIKHVLMHGQETDIPVFAQLRTYKGTLRSLLQQTTPDDILDADNLHRTYILDGLDEVPTEHRQPLLDDIRALHVQDPAANLVLTARQAFAAQYPESLPPATPYHLLDFDEEDIVACTRQANVDPERFRTALDAVQCGEEVRNPFVLRVMLERFRQDGQLSERRSENLDYVITELVKTRKAFNHKLQQRALRMLAVTCETAARNELTREEALRVLHEAIEISPEHAEDLLEELSHSILIITTNRISFQLRSYGEFLAADELQRQPFHRCKRLAFVKDIPIPSWRNTIAYLAEMNPRVCEYFIRHHPEWLISSSPAAFTDGERTSIVRGLLRQLNDAGAYLPDKQIISLRRLRAFITPTIVPELLQDLSSEEAHRRSNAMLTLSLRRIPDVIPAALALLGRDRGHSPTRHAAILTLINAADHTIIPKLIEFVNNRDALFIRLMDCIGSLCTPADFPTVLPLLASADAGLSSAYYHFRELTNREALDATIRFLTDNPTFLIGHALDSYLEPIIDRIPEHWNEQTASSLGILLATAVGQATVPRQGKILEGIIRHVAAVDSDGLTVRAMITVLPQDPRSLVGMAHLLPPMINESAARWIIENAPNCGRVLWPYISSGPIRDLLDPRSLETIREHEEQDRRRDQEREQRDLEIKTTRTELQARIRIAPEIEAVIFSCEKLQQEHWPELNSQRRDLLAARLDETLCTYDLAHTITWHAVDGWMEPRGLSTVLRMIDHYGLQLNNDVPLILALRSWPNRAISNYCRQNGISPAAQAQLETLFCNAEHPAIRSNIVEFLHEANYITPALQEELTRIALDPGIRTQTRLAAIEELTKHSSATETLVHLKSDEEPRIKHYVLTLLVKQGHIGTIMQALATLTNDDHLKAGEVPFPSESPLEWITSIEAPTEHKDQVAKTLAALRRRALALELLRVTQMLTAVVAHLGKERAVTVIRQQLDLTPPQWRPHFEQEADALHQAALIENIQQTPFDRIVRKLKGTTSMIAVKVWCEGPSDRPIFDKLLRDLGEADLAETLDYVGGWTNVVAEDRPERWLDGCREAIMILDGDNGRYLSKAKRPLKDDAKKLYKLFKRYPITLHILKRYGIENYFPQTALESFLNHDLTGYFPPPHDRSIDKSIREHFADSTLSYNKSNNVILARQLTITDVTGTDLAEILQQAKQRAQALREV